MATKICVCYKLADNYYPAKFYPNWFRGFASVHAWFRAPWEGVNRLFFRGGGGPWERLYRLDARTDFDAKYPKRRGSAQESAFWGSQNQYLSFRFPFSRKPLFWGPTGFINKFSPENGFNIGRLESKRRLIVVVDGRSVDGSIDRVIAWILSDCVFPQNLGELT